MSLKDNFYQAVKELLNHGGLVGSDLEEQARTQSELDAYLETPRSKEPEVEAPYQPQPPASAAQPFAMSDEPAAPRPVEEPAAPFMSRPAEPTPEQPPFRAEEPAAAPPRYQPPVARPPMVPPEMPESSVYEPVSEMTVISKNTLVDGNIRSFANISIEGNIKGRVDVVKDAYISGKLVGGLKCNNAAMQGSSVQGDVVTKGRVLVDSDSLLLGDLSAQYADVNGKIKGNLEISGKVEFKQNAVVIGDIRTSAITVMDGANIQGFINTSYLLENADRVFPGQVSIDEEEEAAQ